MRLLDTSTQTLTEKSPVNLRREGFPYAILSHVWGQDEVVYRDIVDGTQDQKAAKSRLKLSKACEQALRDGYRYIWIDTCCIDKSSSSELSEAINSMYAWYQDAAECYAFLDDAPDELSTNLSKDAFRRSRWFTRGWTLQELLAPTKVVFFSRNWESLGEKKGLSQLLAHTTGIDEAILKGDLSVQSTSIAKRMSWAAFRETTRPEDLAYCLMGLFSVNMPMLYGEGGERAFLRLQEELMKSSDDQSLFAWTDRAAARDPEIAGGLLAPSPSAFAYSNAIMPYQDWEPRKPFMMTNRGLHIQLHLTPLRGDGFDGVFAAALDCPAPPDYEDSSFLAIYLRKLSGGDGGSDVDDEPHYARVRLGQFGKIQQRGKLTWIYVRQHAPPAPLEQGLFPHNTLQLRRGPPTAVYTLERTVSRKMAGLGGTNEEPRSLALKNTARSWVPKAYPVAFQLQKAASQLTVALIFSRDLDGQRLAVLVGSISVYQVGFDAIELAPKQTPDPTEDLSLGSFEAKARLSASGRVDGLEFHSVRCSATTVVHGSCKYHLIDIGIEDIKRSVGILDVLAADAAHVIGRAIGKDICSPGPSGPVEAASDQGSESEPEMKTGKGRGRLSWVQRFRK